jgi:hypothetical protein
MVMANRTKMTNRAREAFLEVLRETANVSEAAKSAGVSRNCAYAHQKADPAFAAAWDDAVEIATDSLVAEARRRAVDGVEEPVFHKGEVCGHIRRYSDRMLEILLKAHRPAQFRENVKVEHSGLGDLAGAICEARQRAKQV